MIISYGHKTGVPSRSQKDFDVRTLTHDMSSPAVAAKVQEIAEYGRAHPDHVISVGCAQGKHRSVVIADRVSRLLLVSVHHRDK